MELRPATEDDLALLNRLTNDPLATGEFGWFGWRGKDHFRLRWEDDGLLGTDDGLLVISLDDVALGFVSWRKMVTGRTSSCWNIGIAVAPDHRGNGVGTEAQRLLARYLFAHTQVHRVDAETEVDNVAEQRALEKAGFVREGVRRGVAFRDGQWRDGVTYSTLRGEI